MGSRHFLAFGAMVSAGAAIYIYNHASADSRKQSMLTQDGALDAAFASMLAVATLAFRERARGPRTAG